MKLSDFSVDVNECDPELNIGGCEDICVNTIGSYFCKCSDGQTLVNGTLCNGIESPTEFSVLFATFNYDV